MNKEELKEARDNSYMNPIDCCRYCEHAKAGWDTFTCYVIPDDIHKEKNYLMTVHPTGICSLFKRREC